MVYAHAREQIERVVEVRLDYKGLPTGLIVTGGQLNKVSVRLRGPQELLRSMTNREISYTMDLSGVTPGKNVIPLTTGETSRRNCGPMRCLKSRHPG